MKINKASLALMLSIFLAFSGDGWSSALPVTIRLSSEIPHDYASEEDAEERERFYSNLENLVNLEEDPQANTRAPASQDSPQPIPSIQDSSTSGD